MEEAYVNYETTTCNLQNEVQITYINRVGTSKKEADKQGTHQWSRFGSYSDDKALTNEKKEKSVKHFLVIKMVLQFQWSL